jgi:hypothetical protein
MARRSAERPRPRRPGGGPDRALAQALSVTGGGFYWHFGDRRALMDEPLGTSMELIELPQ